MSHSSIPTLESSSYVLLLLSIGVLKRSVPEMVVFNNLIPEQEKEMIKIGISVIEGSVKPEAYVKKLEDLVKKSVSKSISFDDYTIQQLLGRLNLSKSANVINKKLDKETSKEIKADGTLKEDAAPENTPIRQNDPRFDKLPDDSKMLIWKALHSWGALRDFADPVTKPKLDFALNRFKKNMSKFSPATSLEINKVLAAIDPSNWKQYKPEPVVQDFQLNSVESNGEEIIEEAIDREQIKNLIKQKGSATMLDLLTAIGGKPTQPPNNQQVSLFMAVKKMLAKGEVTRVKDGKVYKYSIGNGTPAAISSKQEPIKTKSITIKEALPVINSLWPYQRWEEEGGEWLGSESGDRGPRIDHGGGDDGDGWMDDHQVRDVAEPYMKKWKPRLEQLKQDLKKKGIDVETYVDYGEKGHIGLQLKVLNVKEKSENPNLNQRYEGVIAEGEYDAIRFFPNSGVHPLVQQSVKKAFNDLQKKYPDLSNMDCRKEEGVEGGWPRLYFTYRGKNLSCKLNLTGDTYTKVMQDIKRRIDPPKKTNARFISPGYRW